MGRFPPGTVHMPGSAMSRLRKNLKKRSASNKIEGNILSSEQAELVIDDTHRHYMKPEHGTSVGLFQPASSGRAYQRAGRRFPKR